MKILQFIFCIISLFSSAESGAPWDDLKVTWSMNPFSTWAFNSLPRNTNGAMKNFVLKDEKLDPVGGINKDTTDAKVSPHFHLHKQAAALAERATEIFVTAIRKEIGDEEFEKLFALQQPQCDKSASPRHSGLNNVHRNRLTSKRPQKHMWFSIVEAENDINEKLTSQTFRRVLVTPSRQLFVDQDISIPVDSTLSELVIKITARLETVTTLDANILLKSPHDNEHTFQNTFQNGSATYIQVEKPKNGRWHLKIRLLNAMLFSQNDDYFSIIITGTSFWDVNVDILTLDPEKPTTTHHGLRTLQSQELISDNDIYVSVLLPSAPASITGVELVSFGKNVQNRVASSDSAKMSLSEEGDFLRYTFAIVVPRLPFFIVVRAKDANGYDIARSRGQLYEPIISSEPLPIKDPKMGFTQNPVVLPRKLDSAVHQQNAAKRPTDLESKNDANNVGNAGVVSKLPVSFSLDFVEHAEHENALFAFASAALCGTLLIGGVFMLMVIHLEQNRRFFSRMNRRFLYAV